MLQITAYNNGNSSHWFTNMHNTGRFKIITLSIKTMFVVNKDRKSTVENKTEVKNFRCVFYNSSF